MFSRKVDLTKKIVLVVGGSSGLGEEIAYAAARQGATVIVAARRIQRIDQVRDNCEKLSQKASYGYQLDVADPENVRVVYEKIKVEVGTVDILVNCAGFGLFKDFLEFDMTVAEQMFRVNVLGLMYLTQKFALDMAEQGSGQIINIASQAGKMATVKSTIYSATKYAVIGFSNALRLELKPLGVKVMTVNPGPIETDFFALADESGEYLKNVASFVLQVKPLAARIVSSFGTNRREINAPATLDVASVAYTLFPNLGDYLAGNIFNKK